MPNLTIDLAGIAAIILAGYTLYKSVRTQPFEDRKLQADVAKVFSDIATETAKRNSEMTKQICDLEDKILAQGIRIGDLFDVIQEWKDGIDQLLDQLCSNGVNPIWKPSKASQEKTKPIKRGGDK